MTTKPDQPAPPASPGTGPDRSDLETYNTVAETVGMMPTLRWKDNAIQAAVVLGGAVVGAGIGYFSGGGFGAAVGAIAGLIGATLVSGLVLMVLGWIRAARRR